VCDGHGETRCTRCKGHGKTEQTGYLNGSNERTYHTCYHCNGTGKIVCEVCSHTGWIPCKTCAGKRVLTCKTCSGIGFVTCQRCAGTGQVVRFLNLNVEYIPESYGKWFYNTAVIAQAKKIFANDNLKPESTLMSLDADLFSDPGLLLSAPHQELATELSALVTKYLDPTRQDETRVVRQHVTITSFPCIKIDYSYNDKLYSLWALGADATLVAEKTPFTDLNLEYYKRAEELYKSESLSEAFDLVGKAIKISTITGDDKVNKQASALLKEIVISLKAEYFGGALLGACCVGVLVLILGIVMYGLSSLLWVFFGAVVFVVSIIGGYKLSIPKGASIRSLNLRFRYSAIASGSMSVILSLIVAISLSSHFLYKKNIALAGKGNTDALLKVAQMYYSGKGVSKDYEKACALWRRAAEQGNASAQCSLANMYYKGHGVARDYKKAFEWDSKAAMQGNVDAQCQLGVIYVRGDGVPRNYVYALKWLSIAKSSISEPEQLKVISDAIESIKSKCTTGQIAKAYKLASEFKPK